MKRKNKQSQPEPAQMNPAHDDWDELVAEANEKLEAAGNLRAANIPEDETVTVELAMTKTVEVTHHQKRTYDALVRVKGTPKETYYDNDGLTVHWEDATVDIYHNGDSWVMLHDLTMDQATRALLSTRGPSDYLVSMKLPVRPNTILPTSVQPLIAFQMGNEKDSD